ncbi:hypothetical protein BDV98DRAFT_597084 [Pterulicium gracile]|uniref:Uncharacterized protein n=1 Tax=Pterulicium gracile TaxID=1884261 RepID=A0A5C3Q649_9AGAR|nr:hypothetical protein BDV98DRAFT_597084 [Pterula gracilis]
MSACAFINVAVIGRITIGCADGSFTGGVQPSFDVAGLGKGSLKFFVQDGAFWVQWQATILGKVYSGKTKLPRSVPMGRLSLPQLPQAQRDGHN